MYSNVYGQSPQQHSWLLSINYNV